MSLKDRIARAVDPDAFKEICISAGTDGNMPQFGFTQDKIIRQQVAERNAMIAIEVVRDFENELHD